MANDQVQKVRGRLELYRWRAGTVGSPCYALPLRSGKTPWRRCSNGEGAAGQGFHSLRT